MRFIFTVFLSSLAFIISAQEGTVSTSNPGLEVQINEHNEAFYVHTLKKKETLYSLATYFRVPLEDLLLLNNYRNGDTVPEGVSIVIPINVDNIRTTLNSQSDRWVPLYYTVKPKETLYKISKIYFPQKIENLISRNDVSSFALKRGKRLLVGWWGEKSSTASSDVASLLKDKIKQKLLERRTELDQQANDNNTQTSEPDLELELDSIISEIVETDIQEETIDSTSTELETQEINYKLGIASWDKTGQDRKNLFVMHNSAKPNSIIRLRYPVTGKEITAKVLCPIPKSNYEKDIEIVISPAVAIALGALDSRFQIQMDYYK